MTFQHAPLDYIGDGKWRVRKDYAYQSRHGRIVVPKGFVSDLTSVPPLPLAYLLTKNASVTGAVVHDWLYRQGKIGDYPITREQADDIMYEVMTEEGVNWFQRRLIRFGLRLAGWYVWGKYREDDEEPGFV